MGIVGGPTIYYGLCRGGPYSLKHLAHHERRHVVWRDPGTKRAIPGMIGPSAKHPGAIPGAYVFNIDRKEWDWQEGD
jgi:hypothetical protein